MRQLEVQWNGVNADTLTCIAAGIAEAYYKTIPEHIVNEMWRRLPSDFKALVQELHSRSHYKTVAYIPLP